MYRDFTYIDDIVDGIIKCIYKNFEPSSKIFNLGNNKYEKIKKVVSIISDYLNITPKIDYLPMQPGDIEKLMRVLIDLRKNYDFIQKHR